MAIEVIDKIKQKNNGTFKIVDLSDVAYDDNVDAKEKIDSELSRVNAKLNEGMTILTNELEEAKEKIDLKLSQVNTNLNEGMVTLTNELEEAREELASKIQEVHNTTLKFRIVD